MTDGDLRPMSDVDALALRAGAGISTGLVARSADGSMLEVVDFASVSRPARPAVSCIVAPEAGDTVLMATGANGQAYILAVLERPSGGSVRLCVPAGQGTLSLEADDVVIRGRTAVAMTAPRFEIAAGALKLVADRLSSVAQTIVAIGRRIRTVAGDQVTTAESVSLKTASRVTVVDGADMEKVGLQTRDAGVTTLRAETAIMHATEDLRLDAKRITMG